MCSGISLWNRLDDNFRQAKTVNIFRSMLNKVYGAKPKLFNLNTSRKTEIVFTQLRVGFSSLNYHLSQKGCIDDPRCSCGVRNEDTHHFLLRCPLYEEQRRTLLHNFEQIYRGSQVSVSVLLHGSEFVSEDVHMGIFELVYSYIEKSERF